LAQPEKKRNGFLDEKKSIHPSILFREKKRSRGFEYMVLFMDNKCGAHGSLATCHCSGKKIIIIIKKNILRNVINPNKNPCGPGCAQKQLFQ